MRNQGLGVAKTEFDDEPPTIRPGAPLAERVESIKFLPWNPPTAEENRYRNELLDLRDLPIGYGVQFDRYTRNYIVYGPRLAFCVTPIAIESGMHLTDYVLVLERLIAAHG